MKKISMLGLLLAVFISPLSVLASGLSKPVIVGPKAIGMGGAFVGVADDPTAIYHNPAGITQLRGYNFEVGMDTLITQEDYTPPAGKMESVNREFIPVPQLAFTTDHFHPLSLGLGIFFPHGNGGKFDGTSASFFNPNEGRIYSMEISPTFALELPMGVSIGGSLRIVRVSSSLKGQQFITNPAPLTTSLLTDLDVSGWDLGMAAGVLYQPCSFFSWGANYRSSVDVTLEGMADFQGLPPLSAMYNQTLPLLFTTGFSIKPIQPLTLAASYDFEKNSQIDQYVVTVATFPGPVVVPERFKDSHTIHFGANYWLTENFAVRAGYAKDLNESIPDTAMNRVVGDIAAHETSFGLGYKWGRYTFEGTWNGRFGERDVPVTATNPAAGHYDAFVNSVSVAVSAKL